MQDGFDILKGTQFICQSLQNLTLLTYVTYIIFVGLQGDHKLLMKEIEDGLHQLHSQAREEGLAASLASASTSSSNTGNADASTAFARIDQVQTGSPAEEAVCFFKFLSDELRYRQDSVFPMLLVANGYDG